MLDVAAISHFCASEASEDHANESVVLVDDRRATLSTYDIALQLEHVIIRCLAHVCSVNGRQVLGTFRNHIQACAKLRGVANRGQLFFLRNK